MPALVAFGGVSRKIICVVVKGFGSSDLDVEVLRLLGAFGAAPPTLSELEIRARAGAAPKRALVY